MVSPVKSNDHQAAANPPGTLPPSDLQLAELVYICDADSNGVGRCAVGTEFFISATYSDVAVRSCLDDSWVTPPPIGCGLAGGCADACNGAANPSGTS